MSDWSSRQVDKWNKHAAVSLVWYGLYWINMPPTRSVGLVWRIAVATAIVLRCTALHICSMCWSNLSLSLQVHQTARSRWDEIRKLMEQLYRYPKQTSHLSGLGVAKWQSLVPQHVGRLCTRAALPHCRWRTPMSACNHFVLGHISSLAWLVIFDVLFLVSCRWANKHNHPSCMSIIARVRPIFLCFNDFSIIRTAARSSLLAVGLFILIIVDC